MESLDATYSLPSFDDLRFHRLIENLGLRRPTLALISGTTGKVLCADAAQELLEWTGSSARTAKVARSGQVVIDRWRAKHRWEEISRRVELSAAYGEKLVSSAVSSHRAPSLRRRLCTRLCHQRP